MKNNSSDYQTLENELRFTREIACGIIRQAVLDIKIERNFRRKYAKHIHDQSQRSAIVFLRSRAFKEICNALGLCHSRIKFAAFK